MYREYILTSQTMLNQLLTTLKSEMVSRQQLRVIITDEKPRNNQQNRFYWGSVLEDISRQICVSDRYHSKEVWHEYLADLFAEKIELTLPDGTIKQRRKSTSEMTVNEFSEYLNQVQAFGAEHGVIFN